MKYSIETIMPPSGQKVIMKLDIKGSLDSNNTSEFEVIISTLINGGIKRIILDIDDLQYIDSTGIGALIALTKKLRKEKGEIVITRYTAQVLTILKQINMEKFIQFFPTNDDGVTHLRSFDK